MILIRHENKILLLMVNSESEIPHDDLKVKSISGCPIPDYLIKLYNISEKSGIYIGNDLVLII